MRLAALLGPCLLLCGCQPALSGGRAPALPPAARSTAAPPATAPQDRALSAARAYLADVRASLLIAYLKDRETTTDAECDSPRFEDVALPERLEVEACRLFIQSGAEYRIEARFSGGLTLIADPDGIRPAGPGALRLLN